MPSWVVVTVPVAAGPAASVEKFHMLPAAIVLVVEPTRVLVMSLKVTVAVTMLVVSVFRRLK